MVKGCLPRFCGYTVASFQSAWWACSCPSWFLIWKYKRPRCTPKTGVMNSNNQPLECTFNQGFCKRAKPWFDIAGILWMNFRLWPLVFTFEKNYTFKCFNCSWNDFSFEESVLALHSIRSVISIKEDKKERMHTYFGDVALSFLPHFCYIHLITAMSMLLYFFSRAKNWNKSSQLLWKMSMIQIKARPLFETSGYFS